MEILKSSHKKIIVSVSAKSWYRYTPIVGGDVQLDYKPLPPDTLSQGYWVGLWERRLGPKICPTAGIQVSTMCLARLILKRNRR